MKSHWIEFNGKRIFFADYSGFGNDTSALQQEVEEAVNVLAAEPDKSVLVVSSFEGTLESFPNLQVIRKIIPRANRAVIKRAVLGIHGPRRVFLTTFANVFGNTRVEAFDTREQALNWLTESSKPDSVAAQAPIAPPAEPVKNMKSHWVEHNGKRVFIASFTYFGSDGKALQAECDAIIEVLQKEPPNSVLAITDITGTSATSDSVRALKQLVEVTNQYVAKRALIGATRLQKYFVDAFAAFTGRVNFNQFPSLQQALDWITKE